MTKVEGGQGCIVDLRALPGRLDVVRPLVDDSLQRLETAGVPIAQCVLPTKHPYNGALHARGFFDSRKRMQFHFRGRQVDASFPADEDTPVHISLGDTHLV